MKKMLLFAAAVMFAASPALAANKTLRGSISDSMCGAHHGGDMHAGQKVDGAACTKKCVEGGAKYVFVSSGKVYQIANQDFAALKDHAGHNVALTGDVSGDSITVSKIEMPKSGGKK
jgi:hypothetical protein